MQPRLFTVEGVNSGIEEIEEVGIMEYKEYKRIIYEPGKVTRIILNRPRYRNAVSHPLFRELEESFDRAADDPDCRVIVVSGAGACFSGGDDAIGLTPESAPMMSDERAPEQLMKDVGAEREVWRQYWTEHEYYVHDMWVKKMRRIPKPTIAMVHGYAVYFGWSLARSMDLIFASEDALFLPASHVAMWDMGPRKTLELLFEHRFMTAREAMQYHVVNRVYPDREILEKETLAFAERVAQNPTSRNRSSKEAVYRTMDAQGFTTSYFDRLPFSAKFQERDVPREEKHRERYEGRGMARTPRALANLKTKLESEGEPVPELVLEALARAAARDDKAVWQKALRQEWREKYRVERAEADAKVYEEKKDV